MFYPELVNRILDLESGTLDLIRDSDNFPSLKHKQV
jgi:hypothetical protein